METVTTKFPHQRFRMLLITVEIYNRWGVLVFERAGYNNDDRALDTVKQAGRVT
jgi:hypothetical protein